MMKSAFFQKKIVMLGFGSIGRAVLPVLLQSLNISPQQLVVVAKELLPSQKEAIARFDIPFKILSITQNNYQTEIGNLLEPGDFLLNLSVDISSLDLILLCREKRALYLDTCTEPWQGYYENEEITLGERTNYMLRQKVLKLKGQQSPTAVITHGANPGIISHLLKKALQNLAIIEGLEIETPRHAEDWAALAKQLQIKSIHIAERDTQITNQVKKPQEFVNTWSVEGFISEGLQPTEMGWGTHERQRPKDALEHLAGSKSAIYLQQPSASMRVRSWTPTLGPTHGFVITHAEVSSISEYLTLEENGQIKYRPTVMYAYSPCPDAVLSLKELSENEWRRPKHARIMFDEIIEGEDELGVLLMGNAQGAYWYGSQLSIAEARKIAPYNNATSLQVVAGIISGMMWAMENPQCGVVEAEDISHEYILEKAMPYLGKVEGYLTDWTPLQHRNRLFPETLDMADPWQFFNMKL